MGKKGTKRRGSPSAKGYSESGASTEKRALRGFKPSSGSPNEDIDHNNDTLRQRARMLYMSAPVATAAINTNRTKIVGSGLTLECSIDREALGLSTEAAKAWQKTTEAEFRIWASRKQNCDALGLNDFYGLQQLALKASMMSGDAFALIQRYERTRFNPYSLRIHLIEADRVCTPYNMRGRLVAGGITAGENPSTKNKIYDGVEVRKNGMVVAYHVCNGYPSEFLDKTLKWTRVLAYGERTGLPNILHIMSSERCEQYRGVSYLAQVIEPLLQVRRYTESELMAALVQSFFTAFIETETDPSQIPFNETDEEELGDGALPDRAAEEDNANDYKMGPGTVIHLDEGEKVQFGNPNVPTAGFETFVKTLCRLIGAALEIPYDVLIKEFNSSYSASRGALMEAWEAFKMRRVWFVSDFCQPVYELWLTEAVARGRIKAPGFFDDPRIREAYCRAVWIGPIQGQLDPLKEVKAARLQVAEGFKTREQVTREQGGGDWNSNIEKLALENKLLRDAAPVSTEANEDGDEEEPTEEENENA